MLGGGEADAGVAVVCTIEPADGHEVGELPDEEDGEEGDGGPLDEAAGGGPADKRGEGAGEGADEGVERGDALERGVDGDVGGGGEQGKGGREEIARDGEGVGAAEDGRKTEQKAVGEADAGSIAGLGDHGTARSARHAGIGAALEGLIEDGGAGGDAGDAEEDVEVFKVKGGKVGAEFAEVQTGGGGDEHHEGNAEFEKDSVGGEEGAGGVGGLRPRGRGVRARRLRGGPLLPSLARWA